MAIVGLEAPHQSAAHPTSDRVQHIARPKIVDVPFTVLDEEGLEPFPFDHHGVVNLGDDLLGLGEFSGLGVIVAVDIPVQGDSSAIVEVDPGPTFSERELQVTGGIEPMIGNAVFDERVDRDATTTGDVYKRQDRAWSLVNLNKLNSIDPQGEASPAPSGVPRAGSIIGGVSLGL